MKEILLEVDYLNFTPTERVNHGAETIWIQYLAVIYDQNAVLCSANDGSIGYQLT